MNISDIGWDKFVDMSSDGAKARVGKVADAVQKITPLVTA